METEDLAVLRKPWSVPIEEALEALRVDPEKGLDRKEAERRLRQFGPNRLNGRKSAFRKIFQKTIRPLPFF